MRERATVNSIPPPESPATLRRRKEGRVISIKFPRALTAHLEGLREATPVEILLADEERPGWRLARRGKRPRQPATSNQPWLDLDRLHNSSATDSGSIQVLAHQDASSP